MFVKVDSTGEVYFLTDKNDLPAHQEVLVEIEGVVEPGMICMNKVLANSSTIKPRFMRVLSEDDKTLKKQLRAKAKTYLETAQKKVTRHNLDMKILDATLSFDEKKLTFYFSAENRIDFRALVADMVGDFKKIIRLQQIGAREQAKRMGGYGRCGRPLCCNQFLTDLESISEETASMQEFGGSKLSKSVGCCGKLMCCLSYENQTISDKIKSMGAVFKPRDNEKTK